MAIIIVSDGPIDRYIREIGVSRETFEGRVRAGDPGAMALYGAEAVYRAVGDLMTTIENSAPDRPPRRK